MPLYEYRCSTCAQRFEWLTRSGETPSCPSCHGTTLERQFSVFAAHTAGEARAASGPTACGHCGDPRGPGACSMN